MACVVCFDDGAHAARLECSDGHVVCSACAAPYVREASTAERAASLAEEGSGVRCPCASTAMAPASRCRAPPYSLKQLAAVLDERDFGALVKARDARVERQVAEQMRDTHEAQIRRLREESASGGSEQARGEAAAKHLQEELLTLKCPRCRAAFVDYEGCNALVCSRCKCGFCAFCLADCGHDAHAHVALCPEGHAVAGPEGPLYGKFEQAQKRRRTRLARDYLDTLPKGVRAAALLHAKKSLRQLGIRVSDLAPDAPKLPPPPPVPLNAAAAARRAFPGLAFPALPHGALGMARAGAALVAGLGNVAHNFDVLGGLFHHGHDMGADGMPLRGGRRPRPPPQPFPPPHPYVPDPPRGYARALPPPRHRPIPDANPPDAPRPRRAGGPYRAVERGMEELEADIMGHGPRRGGRDAQRLRPYDARDHPLHGLPRPPPPYRYDVPPPAPRGPGAAEARAAPVAVEDDDDDADLQMALELSRREAARERARRGLERGEEGPQRAAGRAREAAGEPKEGRARGAKRPRPAEAQHIDLTGAGVEPSDSSGVVDSVPAAARVAARAAAQDDGRRPPPPRGRRDEDRRRPPAAPGPDAGAPEQIVID
mmetsp:Transcript_9264/g.32175  ORF Transcript_9264/g.32175 Transcript_9264/m.32175 type:complete len:599 (+) Transcript_9264:26-1822(+)